jgi:hypothetical protein
MAIPSARTKVSLGRTPGGTALFASRYTRYHWDRTVRAFRKEFPHAQIAILQGAYHRGYEPSAGTHDEDGVLDIWVNGVGWREAEQFIRRQGWYGWWRHTGSWAASHSWHIHMITPHTPNRMGSLIPSQIAAYLKGRLGLARSVDGPDPAPHPKHVDYFDYNEWVRLLEEESMNHVQRADAALPDVIAGLNKAIGELRQVPLARKGARSKIAVLVSARTLVLGVQKFLVK